MIDLQYFKAKICYTACGHLIVDDKILLIKHKKVGSWLSPGGHIEENELPHQTAEREFFEETGVKVRALSVAAPPLDDHEAEILPQPLVTNLHWVSKANFDQRTKSNTETDTNTDTNPWKKGCEQHLGFVYLMQPVGSLDFFQNLEETDGIAWFKEKEIDAVEMLQDVRAEIHYAFKSILSYTSITK